MLTQRTSIAGANAGARNVAPRTALQTASRTRCRRCAASIRRVSAVASARRRGAVPVYATAQLQALGTSLIQKAAKAASPGIFVAGADGQIALRLLKDLAVAGEKVTAGVADVDRAQAALKFAKKYELLDSDSLRTVKLIELDYSDVESLASTIPRRGKLVVVDGDVVAGGNQGDTLPAVLAAAAEAQATPIIITSGPSAAKGGKPSGGLFAFGARADGRGRVAGIADKVGLDDYLIIQAAGLDPSGPPPTPRNLVVAESGTIEPATAGPVGLSDVYDVLTAVLAAPRLPGGPITLSVAGTGTDVGDVRGQLAAALSTIGERNAAEAARKRAEEPAAAGGGSGIFGFGAKQSAVKEPEVEEEEEEAPVKPSLFGFGGTRRIGKPAAPQEEEEEEEKPAAKPLGLFGFGTKKAQVQVEEEEEEEEEKPRTKSPLSLFGFGAKPVQAAEEEEEEEEEEVAFARPASPFSLFGGGAQKKQQVAEPEEDEEEVSAGPFSFGTRRIKARAQQSGKVQELTPAQQAAQARAEAAEETKRRQQEARSQAEALRERRQKEAAEARAAALEAQRRKQEETRTAGAQAQRKREEEQERRAAQARAQAAEAQRRKQQDGRAAASEAARRKQEEARAAAAEGQQRKQQEARAAAAEAAKKKKQDEARAKAEAAAQAREDQRRRQEEARAAAAEAARKKQEEARAKAEAAAKAKAEQQKRRADELKRKQAEAAKARAKSGTGTTTRPGTPSVKTGTARASTQKPGTKPVKQATQVKKPISKSSSSKDTNDSRGMISFPGPRRR